MFSALPDLSVNHYLCPPGFGTLRFMDVVAESGLAGVGLTLAALDELGAEGCRRAAAERNLVITSLNSAGNFTLKDDALIENQRRCNRALVEAAATMEAKVLVAVTGGLSGQPFADDQALRSLPIWQSHDALDRVEDELAPMVAQAAEHGVRIALEPIHPMDILFKGVVSSIAAAGALAQRIEGLGIILDLYHSWWDPDLLAPPPATAGFQICGLQQRERDMKPDRDVLGAGIVDPLPALLALTERAPGAFIEYELFDRHRRGREVADIVGAAAAEWKRLRRQPGDT